MIKTLLISITAIVALGFYLAKLSEDLPHEPTNESMVDTDELGNNEGSSVDIETLVNRDRAPTAGAAMRLNVDHPDFIVDLSSPIDPEHAAEAVRGRVVEVNGEKKILISLERSRLKKNGSL